MAEKQTGRVTLELEYEIDQREGPDLAIEVPIDILRNSVRHRLGKEGPIQVTDVKVISATLDTEHPSSII